MKKILPVLLAPSLLLMAACGRDSGVQSKTASSPQASAQTVTSKVNGKEFILSATPTQTLQPGVARQYGIEQRDDTVLLLVSIVDPAGNAIDPGSAQVRVSVGIAPDAPTEIALKPIKVDGFSNLIGTVTAEPPAKLQIKMDVQDGAARTSQSFTRDVLPR